MRQLFYGLQGRGIAGPRRPRENEDETTVSFSFMAWLGSVNERINSTMQYEAR